MRNLFLFFFLCFVSIGVAQQTEYLDFKSAKADIVFGDLKEKEVRGLIVYSFEVLKDVDSVFIDGRQMKFSNVTLGKLGAHVDVAYLNAKHSNDSKRLIIYNKFNKDERYKLMFNYSVNPKKAMYFIDWEIENGNKQIWTQGQGKYTSNWLPSIDDMNDKIEFDLNITFNNEYEVVANGKLMAKDVGKEYTKWHYDMQKPMSSYLLALTIGKYDKKVEYSKSGIPLEMYYYPQDFLKVEPTYRYTKQLFDFLEDEIGVPYPWQNYKQVPVKDFLYAGMENTSTTIFSDAFVIDSIAFVDKNYVNVNAHELAHQWFGDLVTETSGTHHWLQEGFATYYALLAERDVFGDDYYLWRLYEYAQELLEQDKAGGSTSLLDPKSSSTTFYKKGAWVLHLLREQVGDDSFKTAVKNYLLKHQFKNVETNDFISEVEKTSGTDLSEFVKTWLQSKTLHYDEMEDFFYLISVEYKGFMQLDCDKSEDNCLEYLKFSRNPYINSELITKLQGNIPKNYFESNNIKVRQAVAKSLSKVPSELKEDYESLLNDKSYITIETALFTLWQNFPKERKTYLNKTKDIQGFNDQNVRILWLTLALITEDFEVENKKPYFNELTNYTSSKYGFDVRQNAFQYLNYIQACYEDCQVNLKQATKHHNWRFSKFAKQLLKAE